VSIDPSLKIASSNLAPKRSVLTRTERIDKLKEDKGYDPAKQSVLGLAKTRVRQMRGSK
jgi:small basic protein (TIGR04137 family)